MAVSAAEVKRLRELTGAGMLDCKKALEESDGDFDKAVELLRIKGAKDVGKRAVRTAANGLIAAHLGASDHGVMLELACETDFVAKTEGFQSLAADVAAFVATLAASAIADEAGRELGRDVLVAHGLPAEGRFRQRGEFAGADQGDLATLREIGNQLAGIFPLHGAPGAEHRDAPCLRRGAGRLDRRHRADEGQGISGAQMR